MRFITKQFHAYIDYPVAFALIILPFALGLGASNPLALYLSVATGVAALLLTIITNHDTGLFPFIPYKVHLAVDFAVGLLFVLAPFLFGFSGLDAWFYWANGAAVLTVVGLHKPAPEAKGTLSVA